MAAVDEAERMAIRRRILGWLQEVETREKAELQVGRGTLADVAEIQQRRAQAEMDMRAAEKDFGQHDALAIKMRDAARQRLEAQSVYYKEGRITLDRYVDASHQLAEAEVRTAKTPYERIASKKRHFERLKELEEREKSELKEGRSTEADMSEATMRRIEAELDLHEAVNSRSTPDLCPDPPSPGRPGTRSQASSGRSEVDRVARECRLGGAERLRNSSREGEIPGLASSNGVHDRCVSNRARGDGWTPCQPHRRTHWTTSSACALRLREPRRDDRRRVVGAVPHEPRTRGRAGVRGPAVTRHGPMVPGICRSILDDPRRRTRRVPGRVPGAGPLRAGAIRKSDSVGSWLYGVTVRVAARAPGGVDPAANPRAAGCSAAASANAVAGGAPRRGPAASAERDDGAAIVHEEVVRLPERATARRSSSATLRGADARRGGRAAAAGRLRHGAQPAVAGAGSTPRPIDTPGRGRPVHDRADGRLADRRTAVRRPRPAAIRSAMAATTLPVNVPASLARAAVRVAAGQPAAAGTWSAASMSLADGVLKTMMLKKLMVTACVLGLLGTRCRHRHLSWSADRLGAGTAGMRGVVKAIGQTGPGIVESPKPPEVDLVLAELLECSTPSCRCPEGLLRRRPDHDRSLHTGPHAPLQRFEMLRCKERGGAIGESQTPPRYPERSRGSGEGGTGRSKREHSVRSRGSPPRSPASRVRHECQREGGCREGLAPPPCGRARAQGRTAPEGTRAYPDPPVSRAGPGSSTESAIRPYGRRIDSLTNLWNSSRSLSWPEG